MNVHDAGFPPSIPAFDSRLRFPPSIPAFDSRLRSHRGPALVPTAARLRASNLPSRSRDFDGPERPYARLDEEALGTRVVFPEVLRVPVNVCVCVRARDCVSVLVCL
jgi:hypothetical protein